MYQVSGLSIGCIGISLVICLTIPVFAAYYMKRQQGATLRSFLVGMMSFIFFAQLIKHRLGDAALRCYFRFNNSAMRFCNSGEFSHVIHTLTSIIITQ